MNPDSPLAMPGETETRCRKCGWKLEDVSATATCPNCGVSATASTHGELLRFSHPSFLLSLSLGARFAIVGPFFLAVPLFGVVLLGWLKLYWLGNMLGIIEPVLSWIGGGSVFLGWWLLTRPEPSGVGEKSYGNWRMAVRVFVLFDLQRSNCAAHWLTQ